jgi:hypothetical protein
MNDDSADAGQETNHEVGGYYEYKYSSSVQPAFLKLSDADGRRHGNWGRWPREVTVSYLNAAGAWVVYSGVGVPKEFNKGDFFVAPLRKGTVRNPDETLRSYSSVWGNDAIGTGHARSMLDSLQAWSSLHSQAGHWMQIDLGDPIFVAGVVTQGRNAHDQRVTTYRVEHSLDGSSFSNVAGTWTGNSDSHTRVTSVFHSAFWARYVRIFPQTWSGHMSMRAGVLVDESLEAPTP